MKKLEILGRYIESLLREKCTHSKFSQYSNYNYCPDCGKQLEISWISVKCQECKTIKMAKKNESGSIIPTDKYCSKCGSDKWFSETKDTLDISESLFAIPIKEEIKNAIKSIENKTEVWVEKPAATRAKLTKNIIKARKK